MKKLLIGCLIVIVLGVIAFGVGGYFLYRAASPMVQSARDYVEKFGQIGELEKEVRTTGTYSAPANDELTQEQVDRFARVQLNMRSALGQRFAELDAKYKNVKAEAEPKREPSFTEMMSAFSDLANVFFDAKRAQVNALNQEKFSIAEYQWVRSRIYQAAGVELSTVIDFQKMVEAAKQGTGIDNINVPSTPMAAVPEKNRELVKPHVSKMDEWLPFAFFGL